ncbi:MAG: leucine-rich repeat domain-containing protein [Acetatifactor sp.]|nr:leucine-rich repeat domain-containing protein [Acetatifactor sp.]
MRSLRQIFYTILLMVFISLTLCACEGDECGSDDAVESEEENSADVRETGTPEQLPSRILSDSLIGHRICNDNSAWLPQWAYIMLRGELQECLQDADSGEYTYKLKAVVICNTESYFSMGIQGSRRSVDTEDVEKVVFCVNLDMKNRCVVNLADCVDPEGVREALEAGAYALIDGTDLAERMEICHAADMAEPERAAVFKAMETGIADGDHRYDYYITKDSSTGIFLDMSQYTDSSALPGADAGDPVMEGQEESPVILELDADWFAAWRKQEDAERAEEQIRDMFLYEVRGDGAGEYIAITGVKEEYREGFWERWKKLAGYNRHGLQIPDEINGIKVEEIGADAFNGITDAKSSVELPESLRLIGDRAFAHTGISRIDFPITWDHMLGASSFSGRLERIGDGAFEGCGLEEVEFFGKEALAIGARAFADNENLWAVYVPTADCLIGEDAFAGCADDFCLVYGENADGRENLVEAYAEQSGLTVLEYIPARLEVNYPETPHVLTPEVRNFFYGENGEEDSFDSFEFSEEAPDYGFQEWHVPCGEFCAGTCYITVEASSELASTDGRYSADNVVSWRGRNLAWAEGVEGMGIGESITYHNYNQWYSNNWQAFLGRRKRNYSGDLDGYMRYTEICIVNGYAKSQKTWEENGRVRRLLMYVEDRPYAYLELEDTILPQYFTLPEGDIKSADGGEITFRFVIEDVYPGTVYEDTCLTGLVMEFTGRHGH